MELSFQTICDVLLNLQKFYHKILYSGILPYFTS
jgi:hypothetical protein